MAAGSVSALAAAVGAAALVYVGWRRWSRTHRAWLEEHVSRISQLEEQLRLQAKDFEAVISSLKSGEKDANAAPPPPLYRVVLTGGPCGGKTTALSEIKARLESLGFLVMCAPEAATLLFSNGAPFPHDENSGFAFQKNLLRLQIAIEEAFVDLASSSGRKAMILCDRGLMDGKAYMSDSQWELLLEELKLTPVMMRDHRYDAILHLVTAADGAESFYTLTNNAVRKESHEEAREMDKRTLDCWTGHEHLYIVDNSTGFDEKIRRAMERIFKLIGVPAPLAVNRKFLLERMPTAEELRKHVKTLEIFEVEQTYLAHVNENERCRIRRRQQGSNVSFQHQLWVTETKDDGTESTAMIERHLSAREYFILLKQADPLRCAVSKTLTCFTWGNFYWELNSFKGAQHVAILEVEAESRHSALAFPPMVKVIREVTEEVAYDSYLIAAHLGKEFQPLKQSPHQMQNAVRDEVIQSRMQSVLDNIEAEAARSRADAPGISRSFTTGNL
ncbi:hypothetical protein AB1Y20_004641 [Prymnesium parvum]|uniref:NadR/Ttd14 AAA domain-containing protein n=1 Tax=Prymnesium parvum TaxID=97485 RepID=A0AB34IZD2_PRYPA